MLHVRRLIFLYRVALYIFLIGRDELVEQYLTHFQPVSISILHWGNWSTVVYYGSMGRKFKLFIDEPLRLRYLRKLYMYVMK